jgi:hypothetical protein
MIEETVEQLKTRIRREDAEANTARKKQIEDSIAAGKASLDPNITKQFDEFGNRIVVIKPSIVLPQKTNEDAIKANDLRYPRPATNKPQEGFTDPYGLIPSERKPSIVLPSQPSKYPSSDPRHGMSEELIRSMSMNPDPAKSAFSK